MTLVEKLGLAALHRLDPETAHGLALKAVRCGLTAKPGPVTSDRLKVTLAGLSLPNPIGLAAGFDKNATAIDGLSRAGFGFLEVGGATPRPQHGNPRPRLFRLDADCAAINRFGFNNEGVEAIAPRLAAAPRTVPVGLNLGANKDSPDRAADYATVLRAAGPHVDFETVNVSSPNTEKLRDLQGAAALSALLAGVMEARESLPKPIPIFLKIAPDLTDAELAQIAETALASGIHAIVATNTTLSRDGLTSAKASETGGLSGAPLFEKSTHVLARLARETGGALPLIGVGGIASADDAYAKIKAGATAVQFYTAMTFHGLSLAAQMARGLDQRLAQDGHATVKSAIGTETSAWIG